MQKTSDASAKYGYKKQAQQEWQKSVACMYDETRPLKAHFPPRSQSVGAAEGAMGDSGRGCAEETARERPPPGPSAEETQTILFVTL